MIKKIKKNKQIRLIISTSLFRSAKTTLYLFLNILIWKQSQDIQTLFLFNLVFSLTHTLLFVTFWRLLKNSYRKLWLAIWTIGSAFLFLLLFLFKENVIDYVYLFASLLWFVSWIYRVTFWINMFDITNYHNRWKFEWIKKSLEITLKIIIPIIVWTIISFNLFWIGYEMWFLFGAVLFVISYFIWNIKIDIPLKWKFNLIKASKQFFKNKNILTFLVSYLFIWFTFNTILLDFVLPLLVFEQVGEEYKLWILVSLFSVIWAIWAYIYWRFMSYKNYWKTIVICWFLYGLSLIFLLFFPLYITLVTAFLTFLYVFFNISVKVIWLNVLHELENYKEIKSEYLIVREIFLMSGRTLVYVSLFFIWTIEVNKLNYLFYLMIFIVIIVSINLSKVKIEK